MRINVGTICLGTLIAMSPIAFESDAQAADDGLLKRLFTALTAPVYRHPVADPTTNKGSWKRSLKDWRKALDKSKQPERLGEARARFDAELKEYEKKHGKTKLKPFGSANAITVQPMDPKQWGVAVGRPQRMVLPNRFDTKKAKDRNTRIPARHCRK